MGNPVRADVEQIRKAINALAGPGRVVEVRIPDHPRTKSTTAGYFDDFEKLAQAAARYSGRGPGVYVTLNEINPALLARINNRLEEYAKQTTSDSDVLRRCWLPLDFDPVRSSGIPATDEEHAAALDRARQCRNYLSSLGWPLPVEGDSANGGHLLYAIDLPNDAGSLRLIEGCLHALDWQFSDARVNVDTSVGNAARIWKLYGTVGKKGDGAPDRPHRLARLLNVPDEVVAIPRDMLEALAGRAPPQEPAGRRPPVAAGGNGYGDFDLAGWISRHNLDVAREGPWKGGGHRWVLGTCPWNSDHNDNSAFVVRWPDGTIGAGCHHNGCQGKGWRDLRDLYEPDRHERQVDRPGPVSAAMPREPNTRAAVAASPGVEPDEEAGYRFEVIDSRTFFGADYRAEWLIQRILAAKQPGVVGGPKKCLKTTTLADMAVSLASGTPFLGHFRVYRRNRVLFVSGESGEATIQETARRVCKARDIDPLSLQDWCWWAFKLPQFANLASMASFGKGLQRLGDTGVVILDPLYLAMLAGVDAGAVEAGNLYQIGPLLLNVASTCLSANWTPILCHHARKHTDRDLTPMDLDDLAFSGIAEFARQWVLESRRKPFEDGTGSHQLWLRVGGSVGHSGLWSVNVEEGTVGNNTDENDARIRFDTRKWEVTVHPAREQIARDQEDIAVKQDERKDRTTRDNASKVLNAMDRLDLLKPRDKRPGGFLSHTQVRAASKVGTAYMEAALIYLQSEGIIDRAEKGEEVDDRHGGQVKMPWKGVRRRSWPKDRDNRDDLVGTIRPAAG